MVGWDVTPIRTPIIIITQFECWLLPMPSATLRISKSMSNYLIWMLLFCICLSSLRFADSLATNSDIQYGGRSENRPQFLQAYCSQQSTCLLLSFPLTSVSVCRSNIQMKRLLLMFSSALFQFTKIVSVRVRKYLKLPQELNKSIHNIWWWCWLLTDCISILRQITPSDKIEKKFLLHLAQIQAVVADFSWRVLKIES